MKKMTVLMATVLAGWFFLIATVAAFPSLPDDLNIVQPDSSLPKELAAFSGKWEGFMFVFGRTINLFLIVEKIDTTSAYLYLFGKAGEWERVTGEVTKEYGKYIIYFWGKDGLCRLHLKKGGKYLELSLRAGIGELSATFQRW